MPINLQFSVGVFVKTNDGHLTTTVIPKVSVHMTVSAFCKFIPKSLKDSGMSLRENIRLKAFWYGTNNWLSDTASLSIPGKHYGVLILVDEDIAYEGMDYFNELVRVLPAFSGLSQTISQIQNKNAHSKTKDKVFVVHGQNEAVREAVASCVERLGLDPVVLHRQPNKGRTLIEKFTDYSDVQFAVVILTGDDIGRSTDQNSITKVRYRARQNVILELGYFLGRLGRENVCALYQQGVEIPSDYDGVAFVELDRFGNWREKLALELSASGLYVDKSKLI